MSSPREAVIVCEGYDDRSFWKGWLCERLGWSEARKEGMHGKAPGCYTYRNRLGGLVHVLPVQNTPGDAQETSDEQKRTFPNNVWREVSQKLHRRARMPFGRLVLNVDVDDGSAASLRDSVRSLLGLSAKDTSDGDWALDDGALVSLVLWHTPPSTSPDLPGVPAKQTLERIVCTAICRARPEWGSDVHAWLTGRHEPRGALHKAHGWSYIAGWFADHGPGDYYAEVWREPDIAAELDRLMADIGAHRIVDALAALGTADD